MPVSDRILGAAEQLVASGVEPTVAAVCKAAGVSRSTFYRRFGSHPALLSQLELEPDPGARDRILAAAVDLIGAKGLANVSMQQVARQAGLSRASVYRLFPGKPALFSAIVEIYSPVEPIRRLLDELGQEPPEKTIPALVATAYAFMGDRPGLARSLFFELTSLAPDTDAGARLAFARGFGEVIAYMLREMDAGRLRRMHPLLAMQSLVGPVFMHITTRGLVDRVLGAQMPAAAALGQLTDNWLRAMRPEPVPG